MLRKAPRQKPVLEGDGVNRELFGGKYLKQQPYFSINTKQSKNEQIVINGGFVSGITVGSVIDFFETGTTNTSGKNPLASGRVINASAFSATVKADSPYINLVKLNPWAFIKELAYGTEKLKLFIKGDKAFAKILEDSLKDFQLVQFNAISCDLFLDTLGTTNNWALKFPNTNAVFQSGFTFSRNQNIKTFKESLKQFDRFRYLKGLMINDPDISVKIHLVFLDGKGNTDSAKLKSRTNLGRLELKKGDNVFLQIINTGKNDVYVNIVDIQPDGIINPVLPNKNSLNVNGNPSPVTWENCLVKRADTLKPCSFVIAEPFGEETFKVFLSPQPLDLEDILTTKNEAEAKNKRGVLNGLESIFAASNLNEIGKRGVIATNVNTQQKATVFSFNFQILPQ